MWISLVILAQKNRTEVIKGKSLLTRNQNGAVGNSGPLSPHHPHPHPQNCSFSQKEKYGLPGIQILLCVLRKLLTLSEPEREEGDNHSFIQEIFIELKPSNGAGRPQ